MSVAMGLATLLMLVPSFIVFILKKQEDWVKYAIVTSVAENGEKINNAVDGISKLTKESLEELRTILTASEEQLKAMNEVAFSVDSINATSEELLTVVNKNN